MSEPIIDLMTAMAPNMMLVLFVMTPIMGIAIAGFLYIISRFDAFVQVDFGYENTTDMKVIKAKFSKDRTFLRAGGMFGRGPIGGSLPVSGLPIHYNGKALYRYYSPEPGVFIPVSLALERTVKVQIEGKDEEGKPTTTEKEYKVKDLIPSIGFEAKQAFTDTFQDAEKLYQERNKLMQLVATWGPILLFVMLMLIVIIQISSLAANLSAGVTVVCSMADAVAGASVTAPFMT